MQNQLDLRIRDWVAQYCVEAISVVDLRDLLASVVAEVDAADAITEELVAEIELRLAEFWNGDWTEPELIKRLVPLVEEYSVDIGNRAVSTSAARVVEFQISPF